jgi:hypothetical protein
MPPLPWQQANALFTPFRGSALYSIRLPLFYLWNKAHSRPLLAALHPFALAGRGLSLRRALPIPRDLRYLFVTDYAAEGGYGTLRPLLANCPEPALLAGPSAVGQLHSGPYCDVDHLALRLLCPQDLSRARADWRRLRGQTPDHLRPTLLRLAPSIAALLCRAYAYERLALSIRDHCSAPLTVITPNDFSGLCLNFGQMADRWITLQHGLPSLEYFPTSATEYLLWGEAFRERYLLEGAAADTLHVVGAPRLDRYAVPVPPPPPGRSLLFLSQTHAATLSPAQHRQVVELLHAAARATGLPLRIRLHPLEDRSYYSHFGPEVTFTPTGVSLAEDLASATLVASFGSTAMLEAMLAHRPVLQLLPPGLHPPGGFYARWTPASAEELAELWRSLDPHQALAEQQPWLERYLANPGQGAAAVWRRIEHRGEPKPPRPSPTKPLAHV